MGFPQRFPEKVCMNWEQPIGQTKEVATLWIYLIIPTVYYQPIKAFIGWFLQTKTNNTHISSKHTTATLFIT
jgi:hypothetical protein